MDLGSSRSVETYRRHASIMGFICDRSMFMLIAITNQILLYTAIFLDATAEVAGHFTKQRLF